MNEELFHTAIHMGGGVVAQVTADVMSKPTPCSAWDVRALVNHMVNELAWITPMLQGKTIAEVGDALDGDLLRDDPKAVWLRYAKEAIDEAFRTSPEAIVHLSYGDVAASDYAREVGCDLIVHSWDVAKALGLEFHFDDATAADIVKAMERTMPMARQTGLVAAAIEVADDASGEEKVIGLYGRQYDWAG